MGVSGFRNLGIIVMKEEVQWRSMFGELVKKYFNPEFSTTINAEFITMLFE